MYFSLSMWSIAFARQTNRIARQTKRILRPLVLGTLFRARSLGSRGALCHEPKTNKNENLGFQSKTLNCRTPKRRRASKSSKSRLARTTTTNAERKETRRTLFCIDFARSAVGECCALECLSFLSIIISRRSNRESSVVKEER